MQLHPRCTKSVVHQAALSEQQIEAAFLVLFDETTTKRLREHHATIWQTTRFERSLRLPVSSMSRRAMALWVNDSLDEWRERYVDDLIDGWSDAIARDHHRIARLPGRPTRLLDHMSRAHQTPTAVLRDVVAKLLHALDVFRPGDVLVGWVGGLSVLRALRDHVREHAPAGGAVVQALDEARKTLAAPVATTSTTCEIPLATGKLMERHGGTATIELSHGPNGKPRTEPDGFDNAWYGPAQPVDVEPVAPPAPSRWKLPRPEGGRRRPA